MYHQDLFFDRLAREMNQAFQNLNQSLDWVGEYPPLVVRSDDEEVEVSALVPGIEPEKIDLSIAGDTLTIRGEHPDDSPPEQDAQVLRRERLTGSFIRTLQLPFHVNAAEIKARCVNGVLTLGLKRAEEDRPRRITVSAH